MRDQFVGYYRPSEDELREMWKDCLIVLDSSVLLNIYRYPEAARNDLLEVLENVVDRLWIPHQVALEFQENRLKVISKQHKMFDTVKKIIDNGYKQLRNDLENLNLIKRHSIIDPNKFLENIKTYVDTFIQDLNIQKDTHPDVFESDLLLDRIQNILVDKIGTGFDKQEDLNKIYEEGKERYKYKQPPGYMDLVEKEGEAYSYGNLFYKREFGDLILWKEIINEAKEREDLEKLMFIVDDNKEDWWWIVDSNGKKTIGPRPELVEEIKEKANINMFYMYNSERFLKYAKEYLQIDVKEESIDQVRDVTEISSEIRSERFTPYFRKIIDYLWNDGNPREANILEFMKYIGSGAYGNHSKLSLKPWDLLMDGSIKSSRCLTTRGKQFANMELKIPQVIIKNQFTEEWEADENTSYISILDV